MGFPPHHRFPPRNPEAPVCPPSPGLLLLKRAILYLMRGARLNGWQRTGIVLSVLWVLFISMQFFHSAPETNAPGIASVYLHCITEPEAHRSACKSRAEWFRDQATSEFRAGWPWFALGPVLVVWLLVYSLVWTVRWIRRGFKPRT
jgi:hypothetical protein